MYNCSGTPAPPPLLYFAGVVPLRRVGRANVRCCLECGGELAHLTVNLKFQEGRGESQAGDPKDTVVARPISLGQETDQVLLLCEEMLGQWGRKQRCASEEQKQDEKTGAGTDLRPSEFHQQLHPCESRPYSFHF